MPSASKGSRTKKSPPRKTPARKSPTTAGRVGSTRAPAALVEPRPDWIRTTLSTFCSDAEEIEDGTRSSDPYSAEFWHDKCPVATLWGGKLTVCISDWHLHHPKCYICKATYQRSTRTGPAPANLDLEPTHPQCVDAIACAERAQARVESHPGFERYRQYHRAVAAADATAPKEHRPSAARSTSGRCEHCGEPTKGGRFIAGHDAKLKGDLIRAGMEGDVNAVAEAMARNWYKQGRYPDLEEAAFALVQTTETGTLIAERTAARLDVIGTKEIK